MKSFIIGFTLSLCLILVFISSYWVYQAQMFKFSPRAYSSAVSAENSYCFTSPICQNAVESLQQRITIFCLNSKGTGVNGISGKMGVPSDMTVEIVQGTTDADGKVVFDARSKIARETETEVYCGSVKINCRAHICFK